MLAYHVEVVVLDNVLDDLNETVGINQRASAVNLLHYTVLKLFRLALEVPEDFDKNILVVTAALGAIGIDQRDLVNRHCPSSFCQILVLL